MPVNSQSTDPCEKARALAVSRSALYCRNLVQEGTFGRVYKGTLELAGREQEVIIKTVTGISIILLGINGFLRGFQPGNCGVFLKRGVWL